MRVLAGWGRLQRAIVTAIGGVTHGRRWRACA